MPRTKRSATATTRAEMSARSAEDKAKLAEKLDAQVAAKKLTATERKDRLAQHDELWRSKTENAIAQKIERAHLYSFNLPNYRSSLTAAQLAAWKDFAATYAREDDPSKTLEKQYRTIATAAPDELDEMISGLDPRHTLELDIARQFLTGISEKLFTKHPHLRTLQEIIASQQKLPRVPLKGLLRLNTDTVAPSDFPETRFRVLGVNNETGVFLNETLPGSEIKQRYFRVKPGEFCYNPYRNLDERGFWHLDDLKFIDDKPSEDRYLKRGDFIFNRTNSIDLVGKAAVVDFDFSGTWAGYLVRLRFDGGLNPYYLRDVLSTRRFRRILSTAAKPAGGQANLNVEEFSKISIPYFPPKQQAEIVVVNEKQRSAIQQLVKIGDDARLSASQILQNLWES